MKYKYFKKLNKEKHSLIVNAGIYEFSEFCYSDANTDRITKSISI